MFKGSWWFGEMMLLSGCIRVIPTFSLLQGDGRRCAGMKEHGLSEAGAHSAFSWFPCGGVWRGRTGMGRIGGCRNKDGDAGGGCRAQSPLLHFIRQQTHRQSGRDGDRRAAFSDNRHHHSQHRVQRDGEGMKMRN